ncbi:MAG: class I SAM-dependent methyltransferase [Firmicutes bacterium]|nr:class I SAM-dependent methyltransferase [Bacillota bacterium]
MSSENQCNLCSVSKYKIIFQKDDIKIVKCSGCGLVYTIPMPEASRIKELFLEDYTRIKTENNFSHSPLRDQIYSEALECLGNLMKPGRLLDIGCSYGQFMAAARDKGWKVTGVEPCVAAARHAREHYKIEAINDIFTEEKFQPESFDAVTMWDTLIYMPDPSTNLLTIKNILKKSGVLVIRVDDIEALYPRIEGMFRSIRKKWSHLEPGVNLYNFSRKTLKAMLEKCGFKVLRIANSEKLWWSVSVPGNPVKKTLLKAVRWTARNFNMGDAMIAYARKI